MKDTNIYKKLLEVKKEIGTLKKSAKNPFFKSKYLDLNDLLSAVEPLLEKNGLLLLQPIEDGYVVSRIIEVDNVDSDKYRTTESAIKLPPITDPQKLGSAITYFRRYTLQSLLSLQAEDDDGNSAAKPPPTELPTINDDKFSKYITWINAGTKDKAGKVIDIAYLKAKHTLNKEQENELLDI